MFLLLKRGTSNLILEWILVTSGSWSGLSWSMASKVYGWAHAGVGCPTWHDPLTLTNTQTDAGSDLKKDEQRYSSKDCKGR